MKTQHEQARTPAIPAASARWSKARDYFALTKPKVVSLIMFTAIAGMFLAVPGFPPPDALVWGTIGIALAASSAAAINHVLDARIDAEMSRTRMRPLPRGTVSEAYALSFAFVLGAGSMLMLALLVNALTAILTFLSIIGYAIVYTVWLKRATPQNIVIGGAAGAAPPVLGWTAVTGVVDSDALLLFLIIFAWTPPHFWALAIARRDEYARVGIPMLPVTHGVAYTKQFIWYYTVLLSVITVLPFLTGMAGYFYLAAALILDGKFLRQAWMLRQSERADLPMRTFRFSINYLALLFAALLVDHYLPRPF
jgi:protoheme IX farnesyltransferase